MSLFSNLFKTDTTKSDNSLAIKFNEKELEGFFRYESTNRTLVTRKHWHSDSDPATLELILSGILNKYENHICSMTIISTREQGKVMNVHKETNISEIKSTQLFPLLEASGDDYYDNHVTITLKFSEGAPSRAVLLFLRMVPGHVTGFTRCMRVSLMIPVDNCLDDLHTGTSGISRTTESCNVNPILTSFVIFEDYNDTSFLMEEAQKVESSTISKVKTGEPFSSVYEEAFVHGFVEFTSNHLYTKSAIALMNEEKWYDAYNLLRRVFERYIPVALKMSTNELDEYFYTSKLLGYCLENMGRNDEAAYFYLVAEHYDKDGIENTFRIMAKLADETVPENERTDAFKNHTEDIRLQLKNETTEGYSCNITVGDVINELFSLNEGSLKALTVIKDEVTKEQTFINDEGQIWGHPMRSLLEKDTTIVMRYQATHSNNDNSFIIRVCAANEDKGLYRISIMSPNSPFDDDKQNTTFEHNTPQCISIIMGKETMRFQGLKDDISKLVDTSRALLKEGRAIEGLHAAKFTYKFLLGRWDQLSSTGKYAMLKVACYIGICYMNFHLYYKANYYLRLAVCDRTPMSIKWYVQALGVIHDIQTLNVIEAFEQIPNNNLDPEEYEEMMLALKRRKVYIYVESQKYNEAEALLTELGRSTNQDIREFVVSELDHICQLRAENQNPM